jgi:hypothetical protein
VFAPLKVMRTTRLSSIIKRSVTRIIRNSTTISGKESKSRRKGYKRRNIIIETLTRRTI